jgi:chromosome condensin MukBEF ATPase and DNA-binding subunit MukB
MKIYHTLCLGAVIALTQSALAELPISNDTLGQSESTLDFCAKVNPKSAAKYQEREKALVGNATDKDLADARNSKEYKDSYTLVKTTLGKLPKGEAAKICTSLLEGK